MNTSSLREDEAGQGMGAAVLVVDDEPLMRKLVRTILERAGLVVLDAGSGDEACTVFAAAHDRVGLVLTDIVMPGMDGIALAGHLHLLDPGMPILFMTGYTGRLQEAPGPVLPKPFSSHVLMQAVRRMLPQPA
jgi:CheY-like chemotaxis protein